LYYLLAQSGSLASEVLDGGVLYLLCPLGRRRIAVVGLSLGELEELLPQTLLLLLVDEIELLESLIEAIRRFLGALSVVTSWHRPSRGFKTWLILPLFLLDGPCLRRCLGHLQRTRALLPWRDRASIPALQLHLNHFPDLIICTLARLHSDSDLLAALLGDEPDLGFLVESCCLGKGVHHGFVLLLDARWRLAGVYCRWRVPRGSSGSPMQCELLVGRSIPMQESISVHLTFFIQSYDVQMPLLDVVGDFLLLISAALSSSSACIIYLRLFAYGHGGQRQTSLTRSFTADGLLILRFRWAPLGAIPAL